MARNFKFLTLILSVMLGLSAFAFGQVTTGSIEGTVKDSTGAVIPGASVTVKGTNVGFSRTVTANNNGFYRVQSVPAGVYTLTTAAINGFSENTIKDVTVVIERSSTVDVTMGITQSVNTVEVSNDPLGVVVDTTDSKVQTNITAALIEKLPSGTSFTSLLKISPATRPEPLSGGFQVDGASGSENTFIVDGQPLENFRTGVLNSQNNLPTSLVSEIQIKTGGFEAEHGGASGGVVVVATKSGSDAFHGGVGTAFELSRFQPAPRFSTAIVTNAASPTRPQRTYAIAQPKDDFINSYPNLTLGGPIIKERVWFFGTWAPQVFVTDRTSNFFNSVGESSFSTGTFQLTPRPVGPKDYRVTTTYEYGFGKIDAQILKNLRGTVSYLWNPSVTVGNAPFAGISTSNPVNTTYAGVSYPSEEYAKLQGGRVSANTITSQLVWNPTSNLILTGRYGRSFLNEKGGNYALANEVRYQCAGDPNATPYTSNTTTCPGGAGYQNLTTNSITTRDVSLKNEFNGDATYIVGNLGGRHEFKGGYQFGKTQNDVLSGYAGTGVVTAYYGLDYQTANTGTSLTCTINVDCLGVGRLIRFGAKGIASNKYQAVYFQDKWQPISRLSLNLGVRLENENLPAFNTGSGVGGEPIKLGWGKKVAPRLGAAYDLFGDGKTKIWGSFGWFFDRLKFELPRGSFGGNFYRVDYFPLTLDHPEYSWYTPGRILGSFTDPIGGGNPSTSGGLSLIQRDFRIPSNLTRELKVALGLPPDVGVAPDLKPFRQSEFTVGVERELSKTFVLSARYTRKNIDHAIEDHAIIGAFESENYYIGNPGEGTDLAADKAAGYAKSAKPTRTYNGLEIVLNRRLSNNYYFNVNYTLSRLYGNYSGLASSDENGRTSPGVNRFFDYVINGFTATGDPDDGNLATDRRHALKAYGGYTFDWWGSKSNATDFSIFQQVLQGTPQTTFVSVVATSIPLSKRGDLGRTPTYFVTDFALTHKYKFGRDDRFAVAFDLNITNLWNSNIATALNTTRYRFTNTLSGTDVDPCYDPDGIRPAGCLAPNPVNTLLTPALNMVLNGQIGAALSDLDNQEKQGLYGTPSSYQAPREVRFGFRFIF